MFMSKYTMISHVKGSCLVQVKMSWLVLPFLPFQPTTHPMISLPTMCGGVFHWHVYSELRQTWVQICSATQNTEWFLLFFKVRRSFTHAQAAEVFIGCWCSNPKKDMWIVRLALNYRKFSSLCGLKRVCESCLS